MAIVAKDVVHPGAVLAVGIHDGLIPLFRPAGQGTNVKPQGPRRTSECHAIPIPDGIWSLEIARDSPRRRDAHVPDEWQNARDGRQGRPQDRECEGVILIRGRRRGDGRARAVGVVI